MNKRNLVISLVTSLVVVALAAGYLAAGQRPRLGLDLRGGISAIYTPVVEEGREQPDDFDEVLDETISIIRERVDSLGVAEPEISRQGDDVLVQLPGLDDPDRAREVIGTTAKLGFRTVEGVLLPGTPAYDETPPCDDPDYPAPADDESGVVCSADVDTPLLDLPPPTGDAPDTGTDTDLPATETPTEEGAAGSAATLAASADHRALAQAAPEASPEASPTPEPGASASPTEAPTTDAPDADEETPVPGDLPSLPLKYEVGPVRVAGDDVESAIATIGQDGWVVQLDLSGDGGEAFAAVTGELACRRDQGGIDQLAIVLDNRVESAPSMNPGVACGVGITGGSATITVGGAGSEDGGEAEARDLALVLKTGALPITLEPSTFETVSATLGTESLRSGLWAGLIGLILVAGYLIFFYRWLGLVAIGGLATFGIVIVALIALLGEVGFTLTLAGIAGIVVSIGITADSSIIFFERLRDEVNLGKTVRTSTKRAFASAFRTNLAGNTVTLAAALVLYFLAVGPVRGFALTLGLATVLDILILYFYSRPAVGLLGRTRLLSRRSIRASEAAPVAGGSR